LPDLVTAHPRAVRVSKYLKHIVIIVQENRSFDNIFAGFPGSDSALGGSASSSSGSDSTIPLHEITFDAIGLPHGFTTGVQEYDDGKMDGFNVVEMNASGALSGSTAYAYLQRSSVAPYWRMAKQYALADHMFMTEFGDSFTAHLNLIASTTELSPSLAIVNQPTSVPWNCFAPPGTVTPVVNTQREHSFGPFPCFNQFRTIADSLDAAGVSWKYYAPKVGVAGSNIWTEFEAIQKVACTNYNPSNPPRPAATACEHGPDWANIDTPETNIFSDIKRGKLSGVSWVIPDFTWSDHPGSHSDKGPSWVAAIVNAVGRSRFWASSAIIVVWDDWGGWYDNVPPPQLDYRGLGMRVPCIIISPYARAGYVSHTQYEFGSIVKFVEQTFDLPPLGSIAPSLGYGYTDERAASLDDSFNFARKPNKFKHVEAPYSVTTFVRAKPSLLPPDDY
jgi:phospholipase C